MTTAGDSLEAAAFNWGRWRRRQGWSVGVWLLLVALVVWYTQLIPRFGTFQIASIAKNIFPFPTWLSAKP